MATQLQLRRGTTAENNTFAGGNGEVTVDTQTHGLRVHDGTTVGGFLVDTVVDFQLPTVGNGYTWYRKYSSGWVEQGGIATITSDGLFNVVYPVEMATGKPQALAAPYNQATTGSGDQNYLCVLVNIGTTSLDIRYFDSDSSTWRQGDVCWRVEGMAA